MMIYIIFLSILIGSYATSKPIISLILGLFLIILNIREKKKSYFILSGLIIFTFYIKYILSASNYFSNYGIITSISNNYFIYYNGISKFYVPIENHQYNLFDIIKIEGDVNSYSFYTYEGLFDFNKYLKSKLIFKQINVNNHSLVFSFPIRFEYLSQYLINKFNEEGKIVISELIFSKTYSSTYSSFISENNLFYLLNVSSLHLYYLTFLLRKILEIKIKEEKVDNILIVIYLLLTMFNSFKISLLRYLIYQIINKIDKKKKMDTPYLRKIILTLIILTLIDQSYVFSSAFLYHLFIPLNFVISKNAISTIKYQHQKYIRIIFLYLIISIITLMVNEKVNLISIILIPVFTLIVMVVFILGILCFILPFQGIINVLSKGLLNLFSFINNFDLTFYLSKNSIYFFIFYFLIYFLLLYSLENKNKLAQKKLIVLFVCNLFISKLPINLNNNGVYFINVGQGDSILIHHYDTNILVDTGGIYNKDVAQEILIPFLKKKNIYSLDYVFLTHNDFDHVGGFDSLKKSIVIENYNESNNFDSICINKFTFYNLNSSSSNDNNDDSLVLYFTLNNLNYLLMGDVSSKIEEEIVYKYPLLDVDILKVSHHGSSSSTCNLLLDSYSIKQAIISCGMNYYGHPSLEVINRLNNHKVSIRRTDKEGTIYIK